MIDNVEESASVAIDLDAPIPDQSGEERPEIQIRLSKSEREKIARMVIADAKAGIEARSEWLSKRRDAIKRLEMETESKTWPWEGASNIKLPAVAVASFATAARYMASIFGVSQIMDVTAVGSDDIPRIPAARQFVEWLVTDDRLNLYEKLDEFAAAIPPRGDYAAHVYWKRQVRNIPDLVEDIDGNEVVEKREEVVFEGAWVDMIDTENVILPSDATGVQAGEADWVILQVWLPFDAIARRYKTRAYNVMTRKDFERVKQFEKRDESSSPTETKEEQDSSEGVISAPGRNKRRAYKWHGAYDIDKDGLLEEVIFTVHVETETLLQAVYLDEIHPHGKRPIIIGKYTPRPQSPYGKGVAEWIGHLDDITNTLLNQFIDRATLINAMTGAYESDSLEEGPITLELGKLIPVPEGSRITFPKLPDYGPVFSSLIQFIERKTETVTGVSDAFLGKLNPTSRASAAEFQGTLGEGAMGFEIKNRRFQSAAREIITMMFQLYQAFMPDGFEIKVNPKLAQQIQQGQGPGGQPEPGMGPQEQMMMAQQQDQGLGGQPPPGMSSQELEMMMALQQGQGMNGQAQMGMSPEEQMMAAMQQGPGGGMSPFAQPAGPGLGGGIPPNPLSPFREFTREEIRGQFDFRFLGDPVSGNKQLRMQQSMLLSQSLLPVLAQVYPPGVVTYIRSMLHDFNRKDADEILPDKVIQLLEQQAQSASQMQELQSQLMKAEAQLEQAKGQAEIEVSKANVQDIIARAQERIARIRMDLQAGVSNIQLKAAQIKKAVAETDAVDVNSFATLNSTAQEEMNGDFGGSPAPVPGERGGDTGPPLMEYEEDTGMGGF